MRLGFAKQVLAAGLIVALLSGDILTTVASNTENDEVQTVQDADSVSGNDAGAVLTAEDLNTDDKQLDETVSDGDLTETVLSTEVSGVTITLTAPAGAVPEGAELWAEEITSTEELAVIDAALEKKGTEETQVQRYKAFDIKLLVNGETIQPDDSVTVTFAGDILIPQNANESLEVYHVTDDAVASEMPAAVVDGSVVEMETNHFSTYVIAINSGAEDYTITYRQYTGDVDNAVEIYRKKETVYSSTTARNLTLNDLATTGRLAASANYELNTIVVAKDGQTATETYDVTGNGNDATIDISGNTTISFYYSPINKGLVDNDVTMFDYDVEDSYEKIEGLTYGRYAEHWMWGKYITGGYCLADELTLGYGTFSNCLISRDGGKGIVIATKVENLKMSGDTLYFDADHVYTLYGGDWIKNLKIGGKIYNEVNVVNELDGNGSFLAQKVNININAYDENGNLKEKYLAMGLATKNHIDAYVTKNIGGKDVKLNINQNNAWDSNINAQHSARAIIPGLAKRLSGANYENLEMADGIVEPGYFSADEIPGKHIYSDGRFKLNFAQIGDTYTLVSATDTNTQNKTYNLSYRYDPNRTDYSLETIYKEQKDTDTEIVTTGFFPLDEVGGEVNGEKEKDVYEHNCYFGMRYDFSFQIGDYVGPLQYTFTGDDDMWVFMDGKLVMDLGGQHSAYPTAPQYNNGATIDGVQNNQVENPTDDYRVNLWKYLLDMQNASQDELQEAINNLSDEAKTEKHQITVLYMERGGYDSSCYMQFIIPNVKPMENVIQQPADFELTKVDENTKEPLSGAVFSFTKYKDAAHKTVDADFGVNGSVEVTSNANGKLRFNNIAAGYYTLKETIAPAGYYLSDKEWNVVAIADEKTGKVSISIEGLEGNTITNKPIDVTPGAEKTAKLVDWEKRVYKLDLKALATEKTISNTKDANVLLLVDTSGSMIFTDAQIDAEQLDKSKIYFTDCFVSPSTNDPYGEVEVNSQVAKRLLSTANTKDTNTFHGIPNTGYFVFYVENQGWYRRPVSEKVRDVKHYDLWGKPYYGKEYTRNNLKWDGALKAEGAEKIDETQVTLYTNRSEIFIDAAKKFVNGLSQGSKVSVVTFDTTASVKCKFKSLSKNANDILSAVENAKGNYYTATMAHLGFEEASSQFNNLQNYEDSYVVFFTDGEFTDGNEDYSKEAVAAAQKLKDKVVQIYSIGVGEGNTKVLNDIATSEAYVKKCNNMADVADALTSLGLSSSGKIEGVKIVDEISPFFELCDQYGNVITSLEGATISYQDGKQVIAWDNETVPFGETGLTKTIYVKARDNFAGGNYVETNNKYTVTFPDGKTTDKETPHVNVKSSIKAGEAEDTIFLGETLEDYVTVERQQTVAGVTYDENGKIISITGENGKTYTDLEYVNVSVQWKDAQGNDITFEDIKKSAPTADTKYTATVTVAPKFATDSAEAKQAAEAMAKDDKVLYTMATISATGTYTIKVVTGQIDVVKKIKKDDITYVDGDPIFTFQIEANGKTQTRMVRFTEKEVKNLTVDEDGYVALAVSFEKLEKGCYTVKELSTIGYTLESKNVDTVSTNCKYDDTIKFAVGQKDVADTATNLEATYGKAVYKNKASQDPKDSDKDMVVNKVVIENGKVVIKPQTVPDQSK